MRWKIDAVVNSFGNKLHVILPRVAYKGPGVASRDVFGDEQPGVDALDVLVRFGGIR